MGEVREGTISQVQYLEARNSYLYEVSYSTKFEDIKTSHRLLNERWIFNLDEKDKALNLMEDCCDSIEE